MRYIRLLILALVVLLVCTILGSNEYIFAENVANARADFNEAMEWQRVIADNVNSRQITFMIDGDTIKDAKVYMNDNREIMMPAPILVSEFDCSVRVYDDKDVVIEHNDIKVELKINSDKMMLNGEDANLASKVVLEDGNVYLPLEVLGKAFGCKYDMDMETNTAAVYGLSVDKEFPEFFDYRLINKTPLVKNQGKLGTCWAFASLAALESRLLPEEAYDFSEDHMSIRNSFSAGQNDGGEYTMSLAYLAAWQGPVYEAEDPYGDGESPEGLTAVKHVQEVQIIENRDRNQIKEMIYKYGAVQTSIYTSLKNASSRSSYYNEDTAAYCYIGTNKPNHDVVIIGWDDNYPKENFSIDVGADGAFICQNSWGDSFGDGGIFYVSYYDSNIAIHNVVYTGIEDADNYDNIYQADLCGWVGQLGYVNDTAFFSNVYTAGDDELLEAVSFYATGRNTEYEIYYVEDFENTDSFTDMRLMASGKFENIGYYTVKLDEKQELAKGDRFAVVVKITTPNSERPIAVEYSADKTTADVNLEDGEGYISLTGKKWEHVEETQDCNVCLKAFTTKAE